MPTCGCSAAWARCFRKWADKMNGQLRLGTWQRDDKCTGCGICEKVCFSENIKVNNRPLWGNRCSQCFACLHYYPAKAVQYGRGTLKKGRYTNPNVKLSDMSGAK